MQLSHSRVQTFVKCPYQYYLRYVMKYKTLPKNDPQDALILGHALHTGIEKDVEAAIEEYNNSFPVITDDHINEALKLEYWIPRIKDILPSGLHEVKIEDDDFLGFIDLLVPVDGYETFDENGNSIYEDDTYDLYDFKYSNNSNNYMDSEQLHLYKYYFEKLNPGKHIRKMYFMFVPKCNLRIKYKNKTNPKDETIFEFRKRIVEDLDNKQIEFVPIEYDSQKIIDFLTNSKHAIECVDYIKKPTRLCDWCEYQRYCESEERDDLEMQLPSKERRNVESIDKKVMWIYGAPFSGKTYLANRFPDPLMLNTDGNIKFIDAPYIRIKDIVTTEGRLTKRQFAWDVFKETIAELEKKQNEFKTIVVDLIEDTYEYCRLYMYDKLGIEHESDDSFRAWDKVRTEFLSTIKRLVNLDYENIILISHEDSSKDLTKKSGDKVTSIKPNLQDKAALKIAGMVDIVARVIAEDNDRIISFKTSEVIFGGGRLSVKVNEIPCDYDELMKVYEEANVGTVSTSVKTETPKKEEIIEKKEIQEEKSPENDEKNKTFVKNENPVETATAEPAATETPERKTRARKPREVVEEAKAEETSSEKVTTEEAPVRRRRRVVSE